MNKVTSRDGTTIAFDRSGDGPPVIVVGGALNDRAAAAPLAGILAPDFTVFTYDRRGRGASGDTAPYAVDREVDDLEALIDEAGGSAFVYGHSSGAVLALAAAARGLAITKLAIYEPPFNVDDSRPGTSKDFAAQLDELVTAGRRGDALELFMTAAVGLPVDAVAQMRKTPMWSALEDLAHTLVYDTTIVGDGSLPTEQVASVVVPTLVMDGGASPAWARHAVRAVAEVLPDAHHRTLDGQDHAVAQDVVAAVLKEFFTG